MIGVVFMKKPSRTTSKRASGSPRLGRPPSEHAKNYAVRLHDSEAQLIERAAKSTGVQFSTFIRNAAVMSAAPIVDVQVIRRYREALPMALDILRLNGDMPIAKLYPTMRAHGCVPPAIQPEDFVDMLLEQNLIMAWRSGTAKRGLAGTVRVTSKGLCAIASFVAVEAPTS